MHDLPGTELENPVQVNALALPGVHFDPVGISKNRCKPGPRKKDNPRSEKISCRLAEGEKASGLNYCKSHGITEAKLLRASYLAAIAQTPDDRVERVVDALMQPINTMNLPGEQKTALRLNMKSILKKAALFLLLIFLTTNTISTTLVASTVFKYFFKITSPEHPLLMLQEGELCLNVGGLGCEVRKY